ncbi:MAG: tRNA1(Val) (adenine(37)-N6)-methyltransferase [Lachnospiraceae bacterium]|nr:tRNA1(Val) (adenine(37)-N6)-methyltransferase [Lachnospiraceae bacterium]
MIRLDDLENGNFIYQDTDGFLFGIDAVLLAHYPRLRKGDEVLDLCTGSGVVPLIMEAEAKKREIEVHFTGLELQEEAAGLAARSVRYNGLFDKIRILRGDVKEADRYLPAASFSLVTVNPPYIKGGHGLIGSADQRNLARHEIAMTLEDAVRAGARALRMRGRFTMVHRPGRLAEILPLLSRFQLEPKRLRLVHPGRDREANLLLVEAVKGGNPGLSVEPPLIVYGEDGSYTEELLALYGKKGGSL